MKTKDKDQDELDKFIIGEMGIEGYLESNPEFLKTKLAQLLSESILHLRKYIENPKEKDITWDNPYIELKYAVEFSDNDELPLIIYTEDTQDKNTEEVIFDRLFYSYPLSFLLREMTDYVVVFKEGDKTKAQISTQNRHLKKLTGVKREEYFRELGEKYFSDNKEPTFTLPFKLDFSDDKEPKRRPLSGSLLLDIRPLWVDLDSGEANYLVTAGLDITGHKPINWSKEEKKEFWEALDKTLKAYAPQESFAFLEKLIEPEVKPIIKDKGYISKVPKDMAVITQLVTTNVPFKDSHYMGITNEGGTAEAKWQNKELTALVPIEYLSLFPQKKKYEGQGDLIPISPKTTGVQQKNLDILLYMIQGDNRKREKAGELRGARIEFAFKEYAKTRGYTEAQIARGGKFLNELKRDLISGHATRYIVDLEQNPSLANYLFKDNKGGRKSVLLDVESFYTLVMPKPKSKGKWLVIFKEPYATYILESKQYFPMPLPVIQDPYTNQKKGYLYFFYRNIVMRYASNNPEFRGGVLKVSTLLDNIKKGDETKAKPKRAFNVLCECICYATKFKAIKEVRFYNNGGREKVKLITDLEKFKEWDYNDFKNEVLNDLGLTDIREALVSFNSTPQKELTEGKREEPEEIKQPGEYKTTL